MVDGAGSAVSIQGNKIVQRSVGRRTSVFFHRLCINRRNCIKNMKNIVSISQLCGNIEEEKYTEIL